MAGSSPAKTIKVVVVDEYSSEVSPGEILYSTSAHA